MPDLFLEKTERAQLSDVGVVLGHAGIVQRDESAELHTARPILPVALDALKRMVTVDENEIKRPFNLRRRFVAVSRAEEHPALRLHPAEFTPGDPFAPANPESSAKERIYGIDHSGRRHS